MSETGDWSDDDWPLIKLWDKWHRVRNFEELKLFRAARQAGMAMWIIIQFIYADVLQLSEIRNIPCLFWEMLKTEAPKIFTSEEIVEHINTARAICTWIDVVYDPGEVAASSSGSSSSNKRPKYSLRSREQDESAEAASAAVSLIKEMGKSSQFNSFMDSGVLSASDVITIVSTSGCASYIRQRVNTLIKFAHFATANLQSPWRADSGLGPETSVFNDFIRDVIAETHVKNSSKPDAKPRGSNVVDNVKTAFSWAEKHLKLSIVGLDFTFAAAASKKIKKEIATRPNQAVPWYSSEVAWLEAIAVGSVMGFSLQDRFFVSVFLFTMVSGKRFSDAMHIPFSDIRKIVDGEVISEWRNKTTLNPFEVFSVKKSDKVKYEWLEFLYTLSPKVERDFLLPEPTSDYQNWVGGGNLIPITTRKAEQWLSRIVMSTQASSVITPERQELLKGRLHGARRTLASLVMESSSSVAEVQMVTGHADIRTAARYVAGMDTQSRKVKDKAFALWSSQGRP